MRLIGLLLAAALTACAAPATSGSPLVADSSAPDPSPDPPSSAAASPAPSTTEPAPAALQGLVAYVAGDDDPQIHLLDLSTGESRQLTELRPEHAEFSEAGPLRPAVSCFFGPGGLAWSPDGTRLAFSYGGCEAVVYVVDLQGDLRRVGDGTSPSWSPDGRWLAFGPNVPYSPCGAACLDPALGPWEVLVLDVTADDDPRPLTSNGGSFTASRPIFSPDGTLVAFTGPRPEPGPAGGTSSAAYVVGADGTGQRVVARGAYVTGWLTDGRLVVAEQESGRIHAFDLESGEAAPFGGGEGLGYEVSPDGSRLLTVTSDPVSGDPLVTVSEVDGGAILAERRGYGARWAPDSSLLLMADPHLSSIAVLARDGSLVASYPVEITLGELAVRLGPVPGG